MARISCSSIRRGNIGDILSKLKELLAYMNSTEAYPVEQSDNDLIHRSEQAVNAASMFPFFCSMMNLFPKRSEIAIP